MAERHDIYLLLGSNQQDPASQLKTATGHIEKKVGKVIKKSSVYRTAAWGFTEQPDFLNQVLKVQTSLTPDECLTSILETEMEMGRIRTIRNAPRLIDIDILFFDKLIINSEQLQIPHPAIPGRRFVLVPMKEIAPTFLHPVLKKNMNELLLACTDTLDVSKM